MNNSTADIASGSASTALRAMRLTLYPLTFVVGLVGNVLVCVLVFTWRKTKNFNNSRYFILNLSISDLLVLIMFIPFDLAYLENDMVWKYGLFMCKFINTLSFLSVIVSGTTLAAISVDRYRAVVHPLSPPFTFRTVSLIILVIWVYSVSTLLPFAESLTILPRGSCQNDYAWWPNYTTVQLTFVLCAFTPGFVIPITCIVVFYLLIARHLRKERENHDLLLRGDIARLRVRQNSKMIRILSCLTVAFTICILPSYTIILMVMFYKGTSSLPYIDEVHEFTRLLMTANSCLNPVLYSVVSREFRAELRGLLKRRRVKRARTTFSTTKNTSFMVSKNETPC
ncbi:predicted protein [Nematostella vectensis]|uniref:G-protein coupled receptors family 1 profile domain-containing protein n=2 Tax=Nematostella vectensis TaxID=45351 RepID=A7SIA0_NEMVE|nr:predicted protein [Nematostella vectensis]|eukprot:XP_001628619.1 predicted protein [Nematostella vectensis]